MNNVDGLPDDESKLYKDEEVGFGNKNNQNLSFSSDKFLTFYTGFAAFFFFCAFAIMIGAAFHISPVVNG